MKTEREFLEYLVEWANKNRKDNTIYRQYVDELNDDWLDQILLRIKELDNHYGKEFYCNKCKCVRITCQHNENLIVNINKKLNEE